jgi:hypothetical protein
VTTEQIEQSGQATVSIGGREFTIRKSLLDDLESQQPTETLRRLKAALFLTHSPSDQVAGIENAADIYRAAHHPKSFISLDSADHLLSDARDSGYAGEIIAAWASRYLLFLAHSAGIVHHKRRIQFDHWQCLKNYQQ